LVGLVVATLVMAGPLPTSAQFPQEEPPQGAVYFGCDPGPVEPFGHEDPPLPPEPVPDKDWSPWPASLIVHNQPLGGPIDGTGFNLEHTLWSCPTFRPALRRRILEPFRPAVARVDSGQLPLAPDGLTAGELGPDHYRAVLSEERYKPSWQLIRQLNRRNVRVMLGVWGAPGAFTDDGTRRGMLLPEHIDQYVDYYDTVVDYLVNDQGLSIWAATIMNETNGGDGTFIPPDDFAEVARRLGPRLAAYGVKLYGPDTASAENALLYLDSMLDDPAIMSNLAAVAVHQYFPSDYLDRLVDMVQASGYDLPVYITEYTSFHFGDLDRGQQADDEVGFMLDIAATLTSLYNSGAQAALYWDAVDYYQAGHAAITAWGLLRGPEDAFAPRKRYFGMLQILPYLQPGAEILATSVAGSDELSALAIHTPGDGQQDLAVALVNQGGPLELSLTLQRLPGVDELQVYLTDEDNDLSHLGHLKLQGGQGQLYLPARSIVTLAPAAAPDEMAGLP
jgi:hypothetical protein